MSPLDAHSGLPRSVEISAGQIDYYEFGPATGRPIAFVHGYWMGPQIWFEIARELAEEGFRCIAPMWPLGAHRHPLRSSADHSLAGVSDAVADLLEALNVHGGVVIGNDMGGLITQITAGAHRERLAGVVLTSCDAFENFPPKVLRPLLSSANSRTSFRLTVQSMRLRAARQRAFGPLAHRDIDDFVTEWVRPALTDPQIREDLRQLTLACTPNVSVEAAALLPSFDRPALVVWSADDEFFPLDDGARLADTLPDARLEILHGARTYSMLDRPRELAELVSSFAQRLA